MGGSQGGVGEMVGIKPCGRTLVPAAQEFHRAPSGLSAVPYTNSRIGLQSSSKAMGRPVRSGTVVVFKSTPST